MLYSSEVNQASTLPGKKLKRRSVMIYVNLIPASAIYRKKKQQDSFLGKMGKGRGMYCSVLTLEYVMSGKYMSNIQTICVVIESTTFSPFRVLLCYTS